MIPKTLEAITEQDFNDLAANKVAEGTTLEYKSELPGATEPEKVKFLRAVSSLANTQGGDLIYGIQASQGIPVSVAGFSGINEDGELLRLENICRDGLQERLRNLQMRFVPVANGASVLVIRVPRSWNGAHRVALGGHGHFYARNSAGAYQLDVPQLRSSFLHSQSVADRVRAFREQRLAQIAAGAASLPLEEGAILVFHIAALEGFTAPGLGPLQITKQQVYRFAPASLGSMSALPNFEGYCLYHGAEGPVNTYCQTFRVGATETVEVFSYNEKTTQKPGIPAHWIEDEAMKAATTNCAALKDFGVAPPYFLMLSLLRVKNRVLDTGHYFSIRGHRVADRDNFIFPEVSVEELPVDAPLALMPIFDLMWQSFGNERSNSYDDKGNFQRKGR